jgi:hypothetical protein
MTRERAAELWPIIKAYGEGKEIEGRHSTCLNWGIVPGLVSFDNMSENVQLRIKPEPKTRPMTRGEVLYMVTTTPGMLVRHREREEAPANSLAFCFPIEDYEYAIIDESGETIDGWHKFEKEIENGE